MDKSRLDDETVLVAFELPATVAATSVSLVGDFNGWSPEKNPMNLLDDGRFRTELPLPAGRRWRFRYLLDGQRWENDWAADDYVPNGLGADDSVVDLTDANGIPLTAIANAASAQATASGGTAPSGDTAARDAMGASESGATDVDHRTPRRQWWRFWGRRPLTTA